MRQRDPWEPRRIYGGWRCPRCGQRIPPEGPRVHRHYELGPLKLIDLRKPVPAYVPDVEIPIITIVCQPEDEVWY